MPRAARTRHEPLTRALVLARAVELADRDGVTGLSMRRLAEGLGVEAMSLYHHVASKSDLLDGMVDAVFAEIELPSPGADWRTAMRDRAESARAALTRHPWAVGLMDSRTDPGPSTLRHLDAVLGSLRRGGFTLVGAAHAISLIDSYLYGFVMQELAVPFDTSGADAEQLAALAEGILESMSREALPHLTEMILDHALQPGYAYAEEFAIGLDLLLDGLERRRAEW